MPQGRFLATDIEPTVTAPPMGRFSAADIEAPAQPSTRTLSDEEILTVPGQPRRPAPPVAPPEGPDYTRNRLTDLIVSGARGLEGAGQAMIGLADYPTGGRAGQWARDLGLDLEGMRTDAARFYSPEQQAANRAVEEAHGVTDTIGAVLDNPSTILQSVAESASPMLLGGGISKVAGAVPWLARLGPVALGALGEGAVQAGSAAEQTERETGTFTPRQAALDAASGVFTGGLGVLGGKVAQKLGIADVETMLAGGHAATPTQRNFATQVLYGAISEGLLEELPQSVQEQVLQNLANNRPLGEGVDHAAVLGALSGAVMGGGAQGVERVGQARPAALPVTPREATAPAGEAPAPTVEPPPVPPPAEGAPVEPPVEPAGAQPTGRFKPSDIELTGVLQPQPPITLPTGEDFTPAARNFEQRAAETSNIQPPPVIDTLDTGEQQPRLPGDVGAVREQNVATPEIDMPFSLTPEVGEQRTGTQQGMFGAHEIDSHAGEAQTSDRGEAPASPEVQAGAQPRARAGEVWSPEEGSGATRHGGYVPDYGDPLKPFERAPREANQSRLTPAVVRELQRMHAELDQGEFVPRTWNRTDYRSDQTGGNYEIVGAQGGAPVYHDILSLAPLNKSAKGGVAKAVNGSRADVKAAIERVLDGGDIHNNLAEGAVRVAEQRLAGNWKAVGRPQLSDTWDAAAPEGFAEDIEAALDEPELAAGEEGDDSFNVDELEGDDNKPLGMAIRRRQQGPDLFSEPPAPKATPRQVDLRDAPEDWLLDKAEQALGRRPNRTVGRSVANVKFAWKEGGNLDPLNFTDWYHASDLGIHEMPAAEKVDVLDTGEAQPRLPEAGKVREKNVATPEFDLPFSLTSEVSAAKKGKQDTLFGGAIPRQSGALPVSTGLTRELPPQPKGQAPIPVTPRMRQSDIVEQMRRLIDDIPVSTGRFKQRAYGIYKIKERAIRLKVANNLQTFFHESGHHIDEAMLKISRDDPRWEGELLKLGEATSLPSYPKKQKLQEGAAEFLRTWFTEPAVARSKAPNYTAEFERRLDEQPRWRDQLLEVRDNLQGLISQNPATRGRLRINRDAPPRFPTLAAAVDDPKAAIHAVAARAVDDLLPLKIAVDTMAAGRPIDTRLNAYALARIARGAAGKAEAFLEHGIKGRDGKMIAPAFRDIIKPVRDRLDVLGDYLVARRSLELHGRGIEPGMPVSEARGIIEETEARDDIDALEKAADGIYEFQDAMLEYARLYGSMSRQQIGIIKSVNEQYVPMQRVLDAADGSVRGIAKRIANRELPIKRIRGSGRDIIDPFESIITNTFAMVDMVEKNRAMQALVRQAEDTEDSARWLEKIPTPQVATRFKLEQVGKAIRSALNDAGVGQIDPKTLKEGFGEATKGVTDTKTLDVAGEAAKAGIKAVNPVPDNLNDFLDEMVTVWTPQTFARGDDQIVTVLRNGVREFWQVQDTALYDALSVMGPRTTSALMPILQAPTRLLRGAATLTPGFILRNPGRDTLVAYMQSRYGFIPVYDTVKGLIAQVRGDADAKLFYTSGIAQASLAAQYRQQRQEAVKHLKRGDGLKGVVFHPIDMLRAFSEWTETATRLGEFKLALDAGGEERGIIGRLVGASRPRPQVREETLVRATLAARDVTTDFSRGGAWTKEINQAWAFFNARVQGYVRMAESIQRDPVGVGLKAASLALFSAALWALNADDEEYQEKEPWEKQTYWHLRMGTDGVTVGGHKVKWLRIPKPFEYGYAPDVMEAALDYAKRGDPTRFREMKESLVGTNPKQLVVSLMPTAILPMLEAAINYSSFRDTHIVRPWDMDLESDLQYTEWTSETAKKLGKVIPVAPALIDHLIYGYTAGFGRGVVGGMDTGLEALGVVPRKGLPARPTQQLPIVGAFADAGGYSGGAQSIQDIYDLADRFATVTESVKTDLKRGDPASADARLARARESLPWTSRDAILEARTALKELGPEIKAIYAAPPDQMTPEQKREKLDAVRAEMVDISRRALGRTPLRRKAQ